MKSSITPLFCMVLAACATAFAASPQPLTTDTVFNVASRKGDWGVAGNWNSASLPGSSSQAVINAGYTAEIADGQTYIAAKIAIRGGTLSISNGILNVQTDDKNDYGQYIIGIANQTSLLYVGANGQFSSGNNILIGDGLNSSTTLEVDGGKVVLNDFVKFNWKTDVDYTVKPWTMVGRTSGKDLNNSSGTLYIHNGGNYSSTGALSVGRGDGAYATGNFILDNGTAVFGTSISFGDQVNSVGNGEIKGGSLQGASMVIGQGGTGKVTISQKTSTATEVKITGALLIGTSAITDSVTYFGKGTLDVTGGILKVGTNLTVGNTAGGGGDMTVTGGVVSANNLNVGTAGTGSFLVSNGASVTVTAAMTIGASGSLTFKASGNTFDTSALITASTLTLNVGGKYKLDLEDYAATENVTLTLISYTTKPTNVAFEAINYDKNQYDVSFDWGAKSLTATINYIPEPAVASLLVGALALVSVARRRRK